jgi:hypothetical protein
MIMKFNFRFAGIFLACGLAFALSSCGGGSGSASPTALMSSGEITAFGSVFVNGHEFNTTNAKVVDDDTGAMTPGTGNLEVGMVVSVHSASDSSQAAPSASEIHVSPLARGFVDVSNTSGGTITVMGQTVQLTSGTAFSDHRKCVSATTNPCSAISGQDSLVQTNGTTPGTFVEIHGYLFSTGNSAQIVATLVGALDYTPAASKFKLEGQVTAASASTLTIGSESIDLSNAKCRANGPIVPCSSAYSVGNIVAALGLTAPANGTFSADKVRLSRLLPQTAGATVEVEGKVSSVSGTTFVVRGITVDGSGLTVPIPAVGDKVEVLGTVANNGTSIIATSIEHDVSAAAARVTLAGLLTSVVPGTTSGTFVVTILGQTSIVDATTHIADRTIYPAPTFNISNFDTYLQGKTPFVVVRSTVDANGNLHATGFDIVLTPANGMVGITGPADAAPTVGTSNNTVTVHNIPVIYNPGPNLTVVQGSYILAAGALTSAGAVDTTVSGGSIFVLPTKADHDRCFNGF